MNLTDWKTLYKKESFGTKSFGLEIRVSVGRPLTENDDQQAWQFAEQIENAIMTETMRLDPEQQQARQTERTKLLECFGDLGIFTEELPNGYCPRWCCSQRPWYKVTTQYGVITIGWRKRVIQISWGPNVNKTAETLFPGEDVTKFDRTIHAWSYEKAREYLTRILSA